MNVAEQLKALGEQLADIQARLAKLEAPRDRGPKSEKEMTEQHAFDVKYGVHKDTKHKAAAEALGLSYGQIFSCRGGYTFKKVTKDWKPKAAETVAPAAETAQQ